MNFHFFNSCREFFDYYLKHNMLLNFGLIMEQFSKDSCYLNDEWIKWCVVEDNDIPIATIGFRKNSEFNSDHISSFEVNSLYRGKGIGTKLLNDFIENYCFEPYITLYSEDKNKSFYEHLGFVKDYSINQYFYRKQNS